MFVTVFGGLLSSESGGVVELTSNGAGGASVRWHQAIWKAEVHPCVDGVTKPDTLNLAPSNEFYEYHVKERTRGAQSQSNDRNEAQGQARRAQANGDATPNNRSHNAVVLKGRVTGSGTFSAFRTTVT